MSCSPDINLRKRRFQDLEPGQYVMCVTGDGDCNIFGDKGEIVPGERALALFAEAFEVPDVPKEVRLVCEQDGNVFFTSVYFDGEEMEDRPDCIENGVNWYPIDWAMAKAGVPFEYPDEPGTTNRWTITADQIVTSWSNEYVSPPGLVVAWWGGQHDSCRCMGGARRFIIIMNH